MLTVLALSIRISQHTGMNTLNLVAKTNLDSVSDIIEFDLRKVGHGAGANPIIAMSDIRLSFRTTFNTGVTSEVVWHYDTTRTSTVPNNPNTRPLFRIIDGDTTDVGLGVTMFNLSYLDATGAVTADPALVRRIRVQLMCESPAPFGDDFGRAFWESIIVPRGLQ